MLTSKQASKQARNQSRNQSINQSINQENTKLTLSKSSLTLLIALISFNIISVAIDSDIKPTSIVPSSL